MSQRAPSVDARSRVEIARQLNASLAARYPGWPEAAPQGGASAALVAVFARFAELVVQHINRVPDRDRVAFLAQFGGALLPPQPARVPLTFSLAPGGVVAAVVPAGTQVAAAPAPGMDQPVLFETDTELVVTAAKLTQLFVRIPEEDRFANLSAMLEAAAPAPKHVFAGDQPIEHTLYIGDVSFFGEQPLDELVISFDIEEANLQSQQALVWELWCDAGAVAITPESDGTRGLAQSGDVVFRGLPVFPMATISGQQAHWLRCRLLKPLVRPILARSLTLERNIERSGLLLEKALTNAVALDLSKDFAPLGDRPRFGDAAYFTSDRAFSLTDAQVMLHISVTNPAIGEGDVPLPRVNSTSRARVVWEFWNGAVWQELGTMSTEQEVNDPVTLFSDTTRAFSASGTVSFHIPPEMQPIEVAGVRAKWIRARLASGSYGEEAGYIVRESKPGVPEYVYKPATIQAPVLKTIEAEVLLRQTTHHPGRVLTFNDFRFDDVTDGLDRAMETVALFALSSESESALYLGFHPPAGLGLPTLPLTLYFVFGPGAHLSGEADALALQRISWQFWNGQQWVLFGVIDKTGGFANSGPVSFIVPAGARSKEEFGTTAFWLRVPWHGGSKDRTSPLRLVLQNTVLATQSVTIENETLGASDGSPSQVFRTARVPILEGECLEVRAPVRSAGVETIASWSAWWNVPDFHTSTPADCHYVLDRLTGEITFGDGLAGAIPAVGSANLRLRRYRTGGGWAGNKGANTVIQMKTTVPYIRGVTNLEPAAGGADAETLEQLLDRAPKSFRHRTRAVTVEDYEDLAMLASPAVARARCVPLANLLQDPDAKQTRPGVVSVVIVPRASGRKPLPSAELLTRVRAFLQERQSATVDLLVLGPEYVEVDVVLEIGVRTLDGMTELEAEARRQLIDFMDPLTGGFNRQGWDFGRRPHRSDLLSLVGSIAGVDHIRTLRITQREDRPGASATDRYLACSGDLQLTFTVV